MLVVGARRSISLIRQSLLLFHLGVCKRRSGLSRRKGESRQGGFVVLIRSLPPFNAGTAYIHPPHAPGSVMLCIPSSYPTAGFRKYMSSHPSAHEWLFASLSPVHQRPIPDSRPYLVTRPQITQISAPVRRATPTATEPRPEGPWG